MRATSPFDHEPDRELGRALRELLTAPDDARFTQRVLAAAALPRAAGDWWEVLGDWARPGLAAAVLVAAAAGFLLGRATPSINAVPSVRDALLPSNTPAVFTDSTLPNVDVMLAASFGNDR